MLPQPFRHIVHAGSLLSWHAAFPRHDMCEHGPLVTCACRIAHVIICDLIRANISSLRACRLALDNCCGAVLILMPRAKLSSLCSRDSFITCACSLWRCAHFSIVCATLTSQCVCVSDRYGRGAVLILKSSHNPLVT